MARTSIPEGWSYISDWCIRSEDIAWTICKYTNAAGQIRYELWHLKNQVAVDLPSAEAAIHARTLHLATPDSSSAQPGAMSTQPVAGAQVELL